MTLDPDLLSRLDILAKSDVAASLNQVRRGIEKESLRINADGTLHPSAHASVLGSALTHPAITTDYSENLLEFITPAEASLDKTLGYLADAHKFTLENLTQQYLWPASMPCYVDSADDIPLAEYGSSHVGQLKHVYRQGLKNRYGSMMQAIAGIHYNFSMPEEFWPAWQHILEQDGDLQEFRSEQYLGLIRNYYRYAWLVPLLFGASPAICSSFLEGKDVDLPFEKVGKGTYFLRYATSLRLSDLGYTNSEQASLYVCHNSLPSYIESLRKAIDTLSEKWAELGVQDEQGNYLQLNTNVLQIENELYSPIRPKRVTRSGETPTQALARGGIEYIEVRSLDVNPFSPVGIDKDTAAFMDLLLMFCLFSPSPLRDEADFERSRSNLLAVVHEGRKPGLILQRSSGEQAIQTWAAEIFEAMQPIAAMLDQGKNGMYQRALMNQRQKVAQPQQTPSGRIVERLVMGSMDNGELMSKYAQQYRQLLTQFPYQYTDAAYWQNLSEQSLQQQAQIEAESSGSFSDYLSAYFKSARL